MSLCFPTKIHFSVTHCTHMELLSSGHPPSERHKNKTTMGCAPRYRTMLVQAVRARQHRKHGGGCGGGHRRRDGCDGKCSLGWGSIFDQTAPTLYGCFSFGGPFDPNAPTAYIRGGALVSEPVLDACNKFRRGNPNTHLFARYYVQQRF